MNEFRFSLDLFKGSPCGSVWLLSSRAVRGGPPGEVGYYSLPSHHQTIGDALVEGVLKARLSSKPRKEGNKFPLHAKQKSGFIACSHFLTAW